MAPEQLEPSKRLRIAVFVALLFHASGAIGMSTQHRDWFVALTPLNLLLMAGLLWWTQPAKGKKFYAYAALAFATGMITEAIGTNTGYLFGNYQYGTAMGPKILGVPLLIGLYWFIVTWCAANVAEYFWRRARGKAKMPHTFLILGGALLTTLFDYVMEPGAMLLGYWQWENESIPFFNYVCWFLISAGLLSVLSFWRPTLRNRFALALLLIQALFFLAIKWML